MTATTAATARRGTATLLVTALLAALTAIGATPAAAASATTEAERDFVALVNVERAQAGLGALSIRSDIVAVARDHSATMASDWDLHHNPDFSREITNWQRVAENVGYGPSVTAIHKAFMNSEGHRRNILDDRVTEIGVGVVFEDGRVWVTQNYRRPSSNVTFSPPSTETYGDVSSTNVHAASIAQVTDGGIAEACGTADARFCPSEAVTRGDFAGMLARALGIAPSTGSTFGDVSGENAGYIEALADAELTNGCEAGAFCPDRELTREQMATFFASALELEPAGHPFLDVSSTHSGNIGALYTAGIVSGESSTTFSPRDQVTRAQTASMLASHLG